jgi:hypothetical protein
MIDVRELDNGDLALTVDPEEREDFADRLESRGFWSVFCDAMESYSCNGSYTPFDAGDGNPFVGLTSAPCIAECLDWHDDGQAEVIGRLWYDADYMVTCAMERLAAGEEVIFTLAG